MFDEPPHAWDPRAYLDQAVKDVLMAADSQVDSTVGRAVLLLLAVGAREDADRLCLTWRALTERPSTALLTEAVATRAFTQLLAARDDLPGWARDLAPLDADEAGREHAAYLARGAAPGGPFEDSPIGRIIGDVARRAGGDDTGPEPLKRLAADADAAAKDGDLERAEELVARWVASAGPAPPVAMLAGCPHLTSGPLAAALAPALGVSRGWAVACAGELIAALRRRYPADEPACSWPELIAAVLAARAPGDLPVASPPEPASPEAISAAEDRLGVRLPEDYREFLATCDGLPGDVVFPRLLQCRELMPGPRGAVLVSERTPQGFVVLAPTGAEGSWRAVEWDTELGPTVHDGFRPLIVHHLRLLRT